MRLSRARSCRLQEIEPERRRGGAIVAHVLLAVQSVTIVGCLLGATHSARAQQALPAAPAVTRGIDGAETTSGASRVQYGGAGGASFPMACDDCLPHLRIGAIARSYLSADSRWAWTGQDTTFAAEGVLLADVEQQVGDWQVGARAELFVNQPFDANRLVDTPIRQSFQGNFDVDPLELSQLHLAARNDDMYFSLGKIVTPFGRWYFPVMLNSRLDAPFIRTEAIEWRETGIMAMYEPDIWSFTLALTNGGEDRDTNTSKAGIVRFGIQTESFAAGISTKMQDGVGASGQKQYNNHAGFDLLVRDGPLHFSAEGVYDEYGYRQPFDPLQITWDRSLYGRDIHRAVGRPAHGFGYYLNFGCEGDYWDLMVNYGEFHPMDLGDNLHDAVKRRGILKAIYHLTPHCDLWMQIIVENTIPRVIADAPQGAFFGVFGAQFTL
ncbi:MAG: hypothetical protein KDA71_01980 [Planctomycetales bacterium]|nr:hypothetical protein [Planctomycetales bacterium]